MRIANGDRGVPTTIALSVKGTKSVRFSSSLACLVSVSVSVPTLYVRVSRTWRHSRLKICTIRRATFFCPMDHKFSPPGVVAYPCRQIHMYGWAFFTWTTRCVKEPLLQLVAFRCVTRTWSQRHAHAIHPSTVALLVPATAYGSASLPCSTLNSWT